MTTLYHYDPATREYLHKREASPNPKEKKPLVPAHATLTAPPRVEKNEVARWTGEDWEVVADFRNRKYWLADGTEHTIVELGEPLPEDALNAPPPPTLEEARAAAVQQIRDKRDAVVESRINRWSTTEQKTWARKSELLTQFDAGDTAAGDALAQYLSQAQRKQIAAAGGDPAAWIAARVRGFRDALDALTQSAEAAAGDAISAVNAVQSVPELEAVLVRIEAAATALVAAYDNQYKILKGET